MVAVHGRQGWLPQLLHGLGLDPGNYLYGLFGILLAHVFFNMPLAARLILQSIESIPESSWRLASQLGMRSSHIFRLLGGRSSAASCRGSPASSSCSASPASPQCWRSGRPQVHHTGGSCSPGAAL